MVAAAAIGAAVIGAGASMSSASSQSKAAKSAANQQAQSTADQIALQREARDEARTALTPYVDEGNAARRVYDSAFGIAPTGEGDSLDAARADFDRGFEASPFWQNAQYSTEQALQALRSTNAAMGRGSAINSGKALRGASDITQSYRGGAQNSYLAGLGGIADTGFQASSGIASGGETFANNASSALAQGASAQNNLALAGANATAQGYSNAAGFVGWGAGQLSQQPSRSYLSSPSYFQTTPTYAAPSAITTTPRYSPSYSFGGG